jgi:hypothetical protein
VSVRALGGAETGSDSSSSSSSMLFSSESDSEWSVSGSRDAEARRVADAAVVSVGGWEPDISNFRSWFLVVRVESGILVAS